MMDIHQLSPFISVASQLSPEDVSAAAARGFKAIINNRPDGESGDQPGAREIEAAAARAGLDYRHIPVVSGQLGDADIAEFQAAMEEMRGPVLAFCRTGRRSVSLWALCEARHLDVDAILGVCSEAGYDLSSMRAPLESRAAAAGSARAAAPRPAGHASRGVADGESIGVR